jgi:uncharacterized circularly permuted ATP-grasp superfamily protein
MKSNSPFAVLKVGYKPNLGYIGQKRVSTSNYLFTTKHEVVESYAHAKEMLETFLKRSPEEHFIKSELLTEFIRKRGLTFSKKLDNGESRIFTVPVTNSIVPLAKSTFNQLELNAQSLVMSLRWILQDIYASKSPADAPFVQALPERVREIFLRTIMNSPQYFPQLHHSVMKDYPFFEVVGLDLVLVEDYIRQNEKLFTHTHPEELPFKLLELNAGSPSGASNNNSILEGLLEVDPEFARIKERVLPNDHFDVLRSTFDSIGRDWTGSETGLSVILPPGGQNGAAPEIHQLAAYSGMPYIDASMLYVDPESNLRLRTLSGDDPRVTSIYSRVNADAALFDPKRGIYMRDADTGEAILEEDTVASEQTGKKVYLKDQFGNFVPADSIYAVPQAVDLIHARKMYLGGLNRILDNKLILSTLTHYGPRFYENRLNQIEISSQCFGLTPPDTLAPEAESIEVIKKNPDDWVIKAPDLSGGSGVHILLTLPESKKRAVIKTAEENPTEWAYQKLVKIARIPVAVREHGRVRFSNLAADIRMWCFYGAGDSFPKPKLTHNGLVRYAPSEKGPLSSIVNTSKGGGYAPLMVIDDTDSPDSCTVLELTATKTAPTQATSTPIFIGAQIYQVSRIVQKALHSLNEETTPSALYTLGLEIKEQLNEVLSYLSPKNMEPVSGFLTTLDRRTSERKIKKMFQRHLVARIKLIDYLIENKAEFTEHFFEQLKRLNCLQDHYPTEARAITLALQDRARVGSMVEMEKKSKFAFEAAKLIKSLSRCHMNERPVSEKMKSELRGCLEAFAEMALDRLSRSEDRDLAHLFTLNNLERTDRMEQLCQPLLPQFESGAQVPVATLWELQNKRSLIDSPYVSPEIKEAHAAWHKIKAQVRRLGNRLSTTERAQLLDRKRSEHFKRFPFLAEMQNLINQPTGNQAADLWKILPALPYAKYNIDQFLKIKGLKPAELFTDHLAHDRVALMDTEALKKAGMNPHYAGECFAQKREVHGLFSNSDVITWVTQNASPFIQAYTLGHELVHYHQIDELLKKEKTAMNRGSLDFAGFLNYYGNFLGSTHKNSEKKSQRSTPKKHGIEGFEKLIETLGKQRPKLLKKIIDSYSKSESNFEKFLFDSGSLLAWILPSQSADQVKAVREAIPCLENAKNIRFAKDLGLVIHLDETRSALPSANAVELKRYRTLIDRASMSGGAELKILHLISNHQFYGIRTELDIRAGFKAIRLADEYNSSQQ